MHIFNDIIALLTLTLLEIILGIDNIIFLALVVEKLKPKDKKLARIIGLSLALIMRVGLLFAISFIMGLTTPLVTILSFDITGKSLILVSGGMFLIWKATKEIHETTRKKHSEAPAKKAASLFGAIVQIALIDLVFSIDSVITAVGMSSSKAIMVTAIIVAIGVMLAFSEKISKIIENQPTLKILALSFILVVGVVLIAEGMGNHVPKGYIYFAMAFSLFNEFLNSRIRE